MCTRPILDESPNGAGLKRSELTTEKIAVLPPIDTASVRIATAEKPRARSQEAPSVADVLAELGEDPGDPSLALDFGRPVPPMGVRGGGTSKLATRLLARLVGSPSLADQVGGAHVHVEGELLAHVRGDVAVGAR